MPLLSNIPPLLQNFPRYAAEKKMQANHLVIYIFCYLKMDPLSNMTPVLKNFTRYAVKKKKDQANHLVILKFLLPGDSPAVEYNAVFGEFCPIRHEDEGAGEASGNIKFLFPGDASPVEYNTVLKNSPPLYTAKKKERLNQLVI